MDASDSLVQQIKQAALDIGYVDCGITSADPFADYDAAVRDRMDRFPSARQHYEHCLRRRDPRVTAPWANSVVVCVRRYGKYRLPGGLVGHIGRSYLGDRRVRACPDASMPARFTQQLRDLGLRVKRGGVPDRAAAVRAGVARIGRNGSAYSRQHGSWINIEAWRVDATLSADAPTPECPCPEGCRRCIDACPTDALVPPCGMCMTRCIAWLTYEAPFPVDEDLWGKMGAWIYGCDVCQEVCPLNDAKWDEQEETPWLDAVAGELTPESLARMDQKTYEEIVHPLFWYIPVNDLARWHANGRRAVRYRMKERETVS